jgi:CRP-like cAMP-binding protein
MNTLPAFTAHIPPLIVNEFLELTIEVNFNKDDVIFTENDTGDAIYFIEKGKFAVTANKNEKVKLLKNLQKGDYFGEMALINNDKRSATVTAIEEALVYKMYKADFDLLAVKYPGIIKEIKSNILDRQHELFLREELIDSTGLDGESLHISFKGDASLRETALFRERYESKADAKITELITSINEVIINRCAHQIMINFNSGEIRTMSIFDPFREKIHVVDKFVEPAYIDRHFQQISYDEKTDLVRNIYKFITTQPGFHKLTKDRQEIINQALDNWKTIPQEKLEKMIAKFAYLRDVESLYLRNVKISMIQDAVRMQFNCDGTHIIDSTNFDQFVSDNF